ncbi:MAG: nuclear transport factor 2 family protein [Burkholderiaceae bacterium]
MPKAQTPAEFIGASADETEAAFYQALQSADIERLMACWSDDEDIVCVHPGGPRIVGHAAIRSTFEAIFANGSIQARPEHVRKIDGLSSAVHNVLERVAVMTPSGPSQAVVLATNVYHKVRQGWRMVAHHASPGNQSEVQEIHEAPQVLH